MSGKPTIQDIARRASVGAGTVSRVLNNHPNVSDATRERVLRVIRELDYRPRFSARHMRTQRSQLIGFVSDEVATTPYAGLMIQGAQEAAWKHDKILLAVSTGDKPSIVHSAMEILLEREVEGIIYAAMYHRPVRLPPAIYEVPAVLANCFSPGCSLPSVVPDEFTGGRKATEALLDKGHHRVGFININTLESQLPAVIGRLEGYKAALAARGLPYDETLVRYGYGDANSGYRHALELMRLPVPPTALFCGNDRTAMGAYDALKALSLRIPDDVAIVGFDNQEIIAAALRPPLSTMQLPHYEMGYWAAEFLIENGAAGEAPETVQHLVACPFVERDSI